MRGKRMVLRWWPGRGVPRTDRLLPVCPAGLTIVTRTGTITAGSVEEVAAPAGLRVGDLGWHRDGPGPGEHQRQGDLRATAHRPASGDQEMSAIRNEPVSGSGGDADIGHRPHQCRSAAD